MAIKVDRSLRRSVRQHPGSIAIQVQTADQEAATEALRRALTDIWARMPLNWGGPVAATPKGPFVRIDAKAVEESDLDAIPDIVAAHLVEAGIVEARVTAPKIGGFIYGEGTQENIGTVPRAVVLRVYAPPPPVGWGDQEKAEVPGAWIEEAAAWMQGSGHTELRAGVNLMEFMLRAPEAGPALGEGRAEVLVAAEGRSRLRLARAVFGAAVPSMALAGGGPAADDDELLGLFDDLVALARRLEPTLGYGFVNIEAMFGSALAWHHGSGWSRDGMRSSPWVDLLLGEVGLDAFPYQVLGPGHLRRLGTPPPGARAFGDGRVELALGDPSSWLLGPSAFGPPQWYGDVARLRRDPDIQEHGRRLLAPCLLRSTEASAWMRDLRDEARRRSTSATENDEHNGGAQ